LCRSQKSRSSSTSTRRAWRSSACFITTEGWDDNSGRHLQNFMVVTSEGPYFHSSVDTSDRDSVDAVYVAEDIIEVLKDVGPKNGTLRMSLRATLRFLKLRMRWPQRVRTVRILRMSRCKRGCVFLQFLQGPGCS
jgi:hypothetical protein